MTSIKHTKGVYSLQSTFFPHLLSAKVSVAAGAVPVARDGLGVKRGHHTEIFTNSVQDETRNPQVVSHFNAFARAHLELPLGGKKNSRISTELNPPL